MAPLLIQPTSFSEHSIHLNLKLKIPLRANLVCTTRHLHYLIRCNSRWHGYHSLHFLALDLILSLFAQSAKCPVVPFLMLSRRGSTSWRILFLVYLSEELDESVLYLTFSSSSHSIISSLVQFNRGLITSPVLCDIHPRDDGLVDLRR